MKGFGRFEAVDLLLSKPSSMFLSVLSALGMMATLMLLPLVAKSGSLVPHSDQNERLFLAVCLATLAVACASIAIDYCRRRLYRVRIQISSIAVAIAAAMLAIAQQAGALSL